MELKDLSPKELWQNFADLNAVPRASKKEQRVISFIQSFGKALGLATTTDAAGNVVIRKPATPGMENRQPVVLQSHLDMVHQKNSDTDFDFDTQGIEMYVDGDWVKAKGTTLGADNGIGVAAIMAILQSKDVPHPELEALFTIDEETGMTGAKEVDPNSIKGRILLNLDTEEEDELTIGCAGGLDTNTNSTYKESAVQTGDCAFEISIKGLTGGHSGVDIHRGRANANKLMNRLLYTARQSMELSLAALDGGSLRNAIPRESVALVVVPEGDKEKLTEFIQQFAAAIKEEFKVTDPNLAVEFNTAPAPKMVMDAEYFTKLVQALYAVFNGVYRMSPDIEGLVEASSNLAKVSAKEGIFITQSLQRSSVESTKLDVANAVKAAFETIGCEIVQQGDYPGWKPEPDSAILNLMKKLYGNHFDHQLKIGGIHAGLECGILGAHFPGMDMISFGPTIHGAHSPNEQAQISSVERFYNYLLHVLREIPEKA
jgi:dipeptidase D